MGAIVQKLASFVCPKESQELYALIFASDVVNPEAPAEGIVVAGVFVDTPAHIGIGWYIEEEAATTGTES